MKNASNEIQYISTLIYDDYASKLENYVALNTHKHSGSLSIRVNGSYEIVERGVLSIKEINEDIINKQDFKEFYEHVSDKMNWGSGRSILEFLRWILGLETKVDKIWKAIDFCHYTYKDNYKKQNGLYADKFNAAGDLIWGTVAVDDVKHLFSEKQSAKILLGGTKLDHTIAYEKNKASANIDGGILVWKDFKTNVNDHIKEMKAWEKEKKEVDELFKGILDTESQKDLHLMIRKTSPKKSRNAGTTYVVDAYGEKIIDPKLNITIPQKLKAPLLPDSNISPTKSS